ncbi:MAG TPA: family 16 glycosylhydrolase [Puia sp.]
MPALYPENRHRGGFQPVKNSWCFADGMHSAKDNKSYHSVKRKQGRDEHAHLNVYFSRTPNLAIQLMKTLAYFLPAFLILFAACSKKDSGTTTVTPANLTVTAVVSTDSSGNVNFTATATNAATYSFDFGDNIKQQDNTGTLVYKYPFSGSYTVTVTAFSSTGQSVTKTIPVTVAVALKLVWSDEFDKPGSPDPANWGFDLGTGSGGWGNNELENYTNRQANAIVSNGTLKIIAQKESYNGSAYTSARMLSYNLYSFQYGKIDVRAKLPASTGTWPAIWMLGNNLSSVGWPACGEIDIMEQSGNQKSTIYGTMHYPTEVGQYGDGSTTTIPDASTAFHTYSALWTPLYIKLYVDSVEYYSLSNYNGLPFNQSFFMILNVAMGGNFGGAVDPAFTTDSMVVDYVRIYK